METRRKKLTEDEIKRMIESGYKNFSKYDFCILDFDGTNFSNCDLTQTNFTMATLVGANLNKSNLGSANLTGVDLSDANLTNANLSNINLTDADLSNADLSNTNLNSANLENITINLSTNFSGADFDGARVSEQIKIFISRFNIKNFDKIIWIPSKLALTDRDLAKISATPPKSKEIESEKFVTKSKPEDKTNIENGNPRTETAKNSTEYHKTNEEYNPKPELSSLFKVQHANHSDECQKSR